MAGHSKWANIKHRKAAQDKKRGKLYTKIIREITVGARMGGGEVDDNPRLRAAVDKALAANMIGSHSEFSIHTVRQIFANIAASSIRIPSNRSGTSRRVR